MKKERPQFRAIPKIMAASDIQKSYNSVAPGVSRNAARQVNTTRQIMKEMLKERSRKRASVDKLEIQ